MPNVMVALIKRKISAIRLIIGLMALPLLITLFACATSLPKQSVDIPMYVYFEDAKEVHRACNGKEACSKYFNGRYHVLINRETPCIENVFWGEMEHILNKDKCLYGGR